MYRRSQSVQPFHHNTQSRHTSGSDPGPGPNARRFLCRPAEDCSPFFRLIIVNGKFDICLPPDKLPLPAHLPHPLGQTPPKVKGKGSPYSITGRRVQELIPVFGSQPAGDVSHKPGSRLPLLSPGLQLPSQPLREFRCLVNRGTMGVNSLPKTVTRHRRGCDL